MLAAIAALSGLLFGFDTAVVNGGLYFCVRNSTYPICKVS
jgi:hypothetical protein